MGVESSKLDVLGYSGCMQVCLNHACNHAVCRLRSDLVLDAKLFADLVVEFLRQGTDVVEHTAGDGRGVVLKAHTHVGVLS